MEDGFEPKRDHGVEGCVGSSNSVSEHQVTTHIAGTLAYTLVFVLIFLTGFEDLFKFPITTTSAVIVTIAGFPGHSVGKCVAGTLLALIGVALGAFFFWVLAIIHSEIGQALVFFVIVYAMAYIKCFGIWCSLARLVRGLNNLLARRHAILRFRFACVNSFARAGPPNLTWACSLHPEFVQRYLREPGRESQRLKKELTFSILDVAPRWRLQQGLSPWLFQELPMGSRHRYEPIERRIEQALTISLLHSAVCQHLCLSSHG